jgi:DHA2 family methylenomycin A resistance protein-like MFS transporter
MLLGPVFNILTGRLTDRIGPRRPAIAGYLLAAASFAWIAFLIDDDNYWLLLPGLVALSVSVAPMFTSLLTGLSNAVGAEERGDANALVLTVRWIGAATGTMVLGVVVYSGAGEATPTASPYETAFTILACVALAGALACALLLRGPSTEERPEHHRFRPHL